MRSRQDSGVRDGSESLSATPSPLAAELFFSVFRYGHYYCDVRFRSTLPAGREEGGGPYTLLYVKCGSLCVRDGERRLTLSAGQAALLDRAAPRSLQALEPLEY